MGNLLGKKSRKIKNRGEYDYRQREKKESLETGSGESLIEIQESVTTTFTMIDRIFLSSPKQLPIKQRFRQLIIKADKPFSKTKKISPDRLPDGEEMVIWNLEDVIKTKYSSKLMEAELPRFPRLNRLVLIQSSIPWNLLMPMIDGRVEELVIDSCDLGTVAPRKLPETLSRLVMLQSRFKAILSSLPPRLYQLQLDFPEETHLDLTDRLPSTLKILILGERIDSFSGKLPNLTQLQLGHSLNETIDLPDTLETLVCGQEFYENNQDQITSLREAGTLKLVQVKRETGSKFLRVGEFHEMPVIPMLHVEATE